jgi:glutathione S-transferase
MGITLYAGSGSPFVWKVWLALEHKGLPYELKMLSFQAGDLRKPEFAAISARAKVPAITDGAFSLYESGPICEYLEEKYAGVGASLLPGDVEKRAIARRIAAEADAYFEPGRARLFRLTILRSNGDGDPKEIAAAKSDIGQELDRVERSMPERWLAGELSIADFALYPMLAGLRRLGERMPQHSMSAQIGPRTRAWMARVEALPYYDKTYPPHWRG